MSQQLLIVFNHLKNLKEREEPIVTERELFDAFKAMMEKLDNANSGAEEDRINLVLSKEGNLELSNVPGLTKKQFMDHVLSSKLFGFWLFEDIYMLDKPDFRQEIIDDCINSIKNSGKEGWQLGRNNELFIFWLRFYASFYDLEEMQSVYNTIASEDSGLSEAQTFIFREMKVTKYDETVFFPDVHADKSKPHWPVKVEVDYEAAMKERMEAAAKKTQENIASYNAANPLLNSEEDADDDKTSYCDTIYETLSCIAQTLNPCNAITALGSLVSCISNAIFCQAPTQVFNFFSNLCGSDENVENTQDNKTKFELVELNDGVRGEDETSTYDF